MQAKLNNRDLLLFELMGKDGGVPFERAYRMAYNKALSESVVKWWAHNLKKHRQQETQKRIEDLG